MPLLKFKTINLAFHGVCIVVVVTYGILSVFEFMKNQDSSEISFKPFHMDDESFYPSLSMCLNNPFKEDRFAKNVTILQYSSYLIGRKRGNQNLFHIEYENVSIQLHDFLIDAFVKYKDESFTPRKIEKVESHSWGWIAGVMKCFTFDVPYSKGSLINTMNILFNNTIFPDGKRPLDGWSSRGLSIYYHYPMQFGRSFKSNKRFWDRRWSNSPYRIRFYLNGIEVLRKRNKARDKCQQETSYDDSVVKHIIDIVKCKPPYFNVLRNESACKTKDGLNKAARLFWSIFFGLDSIAIPCTEVHKVDLENKDTDDDSLDESQTLLKLYLNTAGYQEIRQTRAYTMMMLFGNVGGFVGLLLGCTLAQIPSFVLISLGYFRQIYTKLK